MQKYQYFQLGSITATVLFLQAVRKGCVYHQSCLVQQLCAVCVRTVPKHTPRPAGWWTELLTAGCRGSLRISRECGLEWHRATRERRVFTRGLRAERSSKLWLVGMTLNTLTGVSGKGDILAVGRVGELRITVLWERRRPSGGLGQRGLEGVVML